MRDKITALPDVFSADRAYQDVIYQVNLGPRTPGSEAHRQVVVWIQENLEKAGWETRVQDFTQSGHAGKNIIAVQGTGKPWIIIGAHYDSRLTADQDPDANSRTQAVPGANDGASGVAVLIELARTLPALNQGQIWLVFFDLEDQGSQPGWEWILGSHAFAASLAEKPDAVVIVDMIGDKDLNIFQEQNSNPLLTREIWDSAAALGYQQQFIPEYKHRILDDHIPFLLKGIPAVDLIDFDYPYWHTTADTADKVSGTSLKQVGDTLIEWLARREMINRPTESVKAR